MCMNANDALKLTLQYVERRHKRTEKTFKILMKKIHRTIRKCAAQGYGNVKLDTCEVTNKYRNIDLEKLLHMLEHRLAVDLGYYVSYEGTMLNITWFSDAR